MNDWLSVVSAPDTEATFDATPLADVETLAIGATEGMGAAIGMGAMRGFARAGEALGIAGSVPFVLAGAATGDESIPDDYFADVGETMRRSVDYWKPDPRTTGSASQAVGSIFETLTPLATGPVGLIGAQGLSTPLDLVDEGVSGAGAAGVGAVRALAAAGGIGLPAVIGRNLTQRVLYGAGVNVGIGAAARLAEAGTLAVAGDTEQADERFAELAQPSSYGIDAVLGAAFGGIGHLASPRVTPQQADALLTANRADNFAERTAPGVPADPLSAKLHADALADTLAQLDAGDAVAVRVPMDEAVFAVREQGTARRSIQTGARSVEPDEPPAFGTGDELDVPDFARAAAAADAPKLAVLDAAPDFAALRARVDAAPDSVVLTGYDETGAPVTGNAASLLDEAEAEYQAAIKDGAMFEAAITCYLGTA